MVLTSYPMWLSVFCWGILSNLQAFGTLPVLDYSRQGFPLIAEREFVQAWKTRDWEAVVGALHEELDIQERPSNWLSGEIRPSEVDRRLLATLAYTGISPLRDIEYYAAFPKRYLFEHLLRSEPYALVMRSTNSNDCLLFTCIKKKNRSLLHLCLKTPALRNQIEAFPWAPEDTPVRFAIETKCHSFLEMFLRLEHMKHYPRLPADLTLEALLPQSIRTKPNALLLALDLRELEILEALSREDSPSLLQALDCLIDKKQATALEIFLTHAPKAKQMLSGTNHQGRALWERAVRQNDGPTLDVFFRATKDETKAWPKDLLLIALNHRAEASAQSILTNYPCALLKCDQWGWLPIQIAVKKGLLGFLELFEKANPTHFQEVINLLLNFRHDSEKSALDALESAAAWNQTAILQFLWKKTAKHCLTHEYFLRLLRSAINGGAFATFQALLDIDPLHTRHFFCLGEGVDAVFQRIVKKKQPEFLLILGRHPDFPQMLAFQTKGRAQLIPWVIALGNKDAFELLYRQEPYMKPWLDQKGLEKAWRDGHFDLFDSMVKKINNRNEALEAFQRKVPFFLFDLISSKHHDLVGVLNPFLETRSERFQERLQDPYPDSPWEGETIMHLLCLSNEQRHLALLERLLRTRGGRALLRVKNTAGHLPLHLAIKHENPQALKWILEADASPHTLIFEEGPHGWAPMLEIVSKLLEDNPVGVSLLKIILSFDPSKSILTRQTGFARTTPLNFLLSFTSSDFASTKGFESIWEESDFWPKMQLFSGEFLQFLIACGKGGMLKSIFERFPENFLHHQHTFETEIWPFTDMDPWWLTYARLYQTIAVRDGKRLLEMVASTGSIIPEIKQIERHAKNLALYHESHPLSALEAAKWDWYLTHLRCLVESLAGMQKEMPIGFDLQWRFPGGRMLQSGAHLSAILSALEVLSSIAPQKSQEKSLKALAFQRIAKLTVFAKHPSKHLFERYSSLYKSLMVDYKTEPSEAALSHYFENLDLSENDRLGAKDFSAFVETLDMNFNTYTSDLN